MLLLCKKFILAGNNSHYVPGQVLISITSGSTTLELLDNGIYELRLVGGGGGASIVGGALNGTGGSGSAFVGLVYLTKGTYSASAGSLGSSQSGANTGRAGSGGNSFFGLAYAYGATGGSYTSAGGGGATPSIPYEIISSSVNTAGASGTTANFMINIGTASGGASRYGGYGRGTGVRRLAGQSASFITGTAGYVYLAFAGK